MRLLHSEDATVEVAKQPTDLDQQSLAAAEQLRSRRPASNFEEMGIPVGSILQFTRDATTVVVVGPRKVKLGDEEMSLTAATRQLLAIEHNVQPSPYWMFEGRSLSEIYEETYGDDE